MADENERNPFDELSLGLAQIEQLGQGVATDAAATSRRTSYFVPAANSQPLGARTGAPPQTRVFSLLIRDTPILLEGPNKQSRSIKVTAPDLPFGIFVGTESGVRAVGRALTPGIPYEVIVPGYQALYAITDAPGMWIPVLVQVAALLAGDRERQWNWDEDEIAEPPLLPPLQ